MAKTKFRFSIFGLSYRSNWGSEVMMESEDPLQNFWKGIFVQEGSNGTHFDPGQFGIKTFPIYSRPNVGYVKKKKKNI